MGELSKERLQKFRDISYKYYDWNIVLRDGGITEVQDLEDQLVIKCFRHPDKRPSCRIRLKHHDCHCFSCGYWGTIVDVMYELSRTSLSKVQYFEQLLKSSPGMQQELGFNSLFVDSKTLDPAFDMRRRFSSKDHLGAKMPVSVLSRKVRKLGDTWENLVFSLTLLQEGEVTDAIYARLSSMNSACSDSKVDSSAGQISLLSLIED